MLQLSTLSFLGLGLCCYNTVKVIQQLSSYTGDKSPQVPLNAILLAQVEQPTFRMLAAELCHKIKNVLDGQTYDQGKLMCL